MKLAATLFSCFWIIAQVSADPLSGYSGWAGFIVSAPVLAWVLLVRIPQERKEFLALMTDKDKQLADKDKQLSEKDRMHVEAVQAVVSHCDSELAKIRGEFREVVQQLSRSIESLQSHRGP